MSGSFFCLPITVRWVTNWVLLIFLSKLAQSRPTLFPKESLVVEILEDCPPTDELLEAIKTLHRAGYRIALDDFVPNRVWKRLSAFIHIIKFDIRIVLISRKRPSILDHSPALILSSLAEKVETYQEYEQAIDGRLSLFPWLLFQ